MSSQELSKDFLSKARWVADMMKADGITPAQFTEDLTLAYMESISRKIRQFQGLCLTRSECNQVIKDFVLAEIK